MSVTFEDSHDHVDALLTWEQFLALPYETRNTDLIDGKLVVNSPNAQHERIIGNLLFALHLWRRAIGRRLGEPSTQQPVKINDRRGYQPDMAWYPIEQCAPADQRAAFVGLPAIVVEVLSPFTRRIDLVRKRSDYDRLGIAELWIIDPDTESMLIARRAGAGAPFVDDVLDRQAQLTSPLLPDFTVDVMSLFVDEQ